MFKKNLIVKMSVLAAVAALSLAGCTSSTPETTAAETTAEATTKAAEETSKEAKESAAAETSAEAPAVGGGFEEFPIGDEKEVGPLVVSGVYFQPVDMEPAGNSIPKAEADAHIEADITASAEGATLGYG